MNFDPKVIRRALMVAKDLATKIDPGFAVHKLPMPPEGVPLERAKGGQVETIEGPERQQNLDRFMEDAHPSIPKVLYHGTTYNVPEFTHEHAPHRGGLLAFFSESPKFSSKYAEGEEGNVLPVHVNIKNPFDFRDKFAHIDARNFFRDNGGINKWDADKIRQGLGLEPGKLTEDQFVRAVQKGHWTALEANEFVEWLRGLARTL